MKLSREARHSGILRPHPSALGNSFRSSSAGTEERQWRSPVEYSIEDRLEEIRIPSIRGTDARRAGSCSPTWPARMARRTVLRSAGRHRRGSTPGAGRVPLREDGRTSSRATSASSPSRRRAGVAEGDRLVSALGEVGAEARLEKEDSPAPTSGPVDALRQGHREGGDDFRAPVRRSRHELLQNRRPRCRQLATKWVYHFGGSASGGGASMKDCSAAGGKAFSRSRISACPFPRLSAPIAPCTVFHRQPKRKNPTASRPSHAPPLSRPPKKFGDVRNPMPVSGPQLELSARPPPQPPPQRPDRRPPPPLSGDRRAAGQLSPLHPDVLNVVDNAASSVSTARAFRHGHGAEAGCRARPSGRRSTRHSAGSKDRLQASAVSPAGWTTMSSPRRQSLTVAPVGVRRRSRRRRLHPRSLAGRLRRCGANVVAGDPRPPISSSRKAISRSEDLLSPNTPGSTAQLHDMQVGSTPLLQTPAAPPGFFVVAWASSQGDLRRPPRRRRRLRRGLPASPCSSTGSSPPARPRQRSAVRSPERPGSASPRAAACSGRRRGMGRPASAALAPARRLSALKKGGITVDGREQCRARLP